MTDSYNSAMNASAAVSIGNYKGVMLCNRPFNGVSSTLAKENRFTSKSNEVDNSKAAFLVGNPGEPLGLNVPIYSEPVHAIKRDKRNTALSKHKKWLHDLQKERNRLQEALLQDEDQKKQQKERFSQREAKFREAVRNNDNNNDHEGVDKKSLGRPMWALTKANAEEKLECMEDAEANDLIDFANNLDIDQFMDDMEIKARVIQVEQQLAQIQSIVDYEEAEEKRQERELYRQEEGKVVPLNANDLARFDRSMAKDADDDCMSVASSVLSDCKSIRSVHSMRSVTVLTKRAEAKLLDQHQDTSLNPRVVTIDEEQGIRQQIKTLPSNLPYIHRNPAI